MPDAPRNILLLAGRLPEWADAWRVAPLADRLRRLGLAVQVVCAAPGHGLGLAADWVESPGLASGWLRSWAIRRLTGPKGPARPDVLHVLQPEMHAAGLGLAVRWQVPYVLSVDEFVPPGSRIRASRRWCRALIVPGPELADDLVRSLAVPSSLVSVVPPGVPVYEGNPRAPSRPRVPVVGAAGPLVFGSGLVTFLNAARNIVDSGLDAEFIIAGHGPAESDLRRHAERQRIAERITFTSHAGPWDTFWNVLDLYCHTALAPTVGRPLAFALSHGVPVITTDVAGLGMWMPDDMRWPTVPPGDAEALTAAIRSGLANPEDARQRGQRGRDWITSAFCPDREAAALAALYGRTAGAADQGPVPVAGAPRLEPLTS